MRLLFKNTIKKIGNSFGRFLSIMLIIALGISIFMGLRESTAGMLYTADNYYDTYNLMDFKIISTHGITKKDILSINKIDSVDKVIGSYSEDVIYNGNSIKVHSLELSVNNLELVEGKYPKTDNECLADYYKFKLNEKVEFTRKKDSILKLNECTVVGLTKSVLYVREDKGISTVGNGKLHSYIFVNKSNFDSDYFTEMYVIGENTREKRSYYDDYVEKTDIIKKDLEQIRPIRETIRYEEILKEARDIIEDENTKLNNEVYKEEIKLNNEYRKLINGQKELNDEKTKTLKKFEDAKLEIKKNEDKINKSLQEFNINKKDIDSLTKQLKGSKSVLEQQLNELDCDFAPCDELTLQLEEINKNIEQLILLKESIIKIDKSKKEIKANEEIFNKKIKEEQDKINTGHFEINKGSKEIKDAKLEIKESIDKEKEKLKDLDKPKWYVLDRTSNSGYTGFREDVIKVEAVSKVIPVFFIIVAMLMILNTLARLIEEERTEMGILLSNGFSKLSIISSYFIYVFLSGTIGIIIGLSVGYSIVPKIIYSTFLNRYYVPKLITIVSPIPFTLVITTTLLLMLIVTTMATYKELKEVPANLLRPKPPKVGKKVLVERIDFLWNKLNFMNRTIIRNIFRYKKRIVMTTIGIAGTFALLIAGLGIKTSINGAADIQFNEIIKYDSMYVLNNEVKDIPEKINTLFRDHSIVNPMLINQKTYSYEFDGKTEDVFVISPKDDLYFNNYVNLYSVTKNKKITIPKTGAVITKQMSEQLNININDKIQIRNTDNELFILKVSDIVENYVSHYIYISNEYYEDIFNENIKYNTILTNGTVPSNVKVTDYDILMIQNTKDTIKTFDVFVEGINKIIIMIVLFALALAFVVLYNLTIINVSERRRELATFKVLGFYDNEINEFIYKETIILTLIGILFGLGLGKVFHLFVIKTAQTDDMMFLTTIKPTTFIISAISIIVFSFIVQLLINKTIKDINMIDSLKSVE